MRRHLRDEPLDQLDDPHTGQIKQARRELPVPSGQAWPSWIGSGSSKSSQALASAPEGRSRVPADSPDKISVGCLSVTDRYPVDALGLGWTALHEVNPLSQFYSDARCRVDLEYTRVTDLVRPLRGSNVDGETVSQSVPLVGGLTSSLTKTCRSSVSSSD